MTRKNTLRCVVLCSFLLSAGNSVAQTFAWRGQLSGWAGGAETNSVGLRYIPELSLGRELPDGTLLDAEGSARISLSSVFTSANHLPVEQVLKPYRLWVRYATPRWETRLGLQKINFGSALLLRPLMWFDRIDARDPLQLTDGVYSLLSRYYFPSNANIWFWALLGNSDTRGWDFYSTKRRRPEAGGRLQFPFFGGELAGTVHYRRASQPEKDDDFPEYRLALDGRWDLGVGFWFEISRISWPAGETPYNRLTMLALGSDYTIGVGNGLRLLAEHLHNTLSPHGADGNFSAFWLSYPMGLLDNLSGIIYYDWKSSHWYRLLTWQRSTDRFQFNLLLFWNPSRVAIYRSVGNADLFSGRGVQLLVVFNH